MSEYYNNLWLNNFDSWANSFKKEMLRKKLPISKIDKIIEKSKKKHQYISNQIEFKNKLDLSYT